LTFSKKMNSTSRFARKNISILGRFKVQPIWTEKLEKGLLFLSKTHVWNSLGSLCLTFGQYWHQGSFLLENRDFILGRLSARDSDFSFKTDESKEFLISIIPSSRLQVEACRFLISGKDGLVLNQKTSLALRSSNSISFKDLLLIFRKMTGWRSPFKMPGTTPIPKDHLQVPK